jgi:transposase-like protein
MDPTQAFCHNPACPDRGKLGQGNIKPHSQKERRLRCDTCQKTFAASKGTPFYRLHKDTTLMLIVLTLRAHGCPPQAIVAAYGLDERTVADWQHKGGQHGQRVQQHFLDTKPLELQPVQADELYGKVQGGRLWLAMAMAVPSRLWLGGVISPVRDLGLIQALVTLVRKAWRPGQTLLVCVDGLASYVTAFWLAFREKVRTGRPGRPSFRWPQGLMLAQVVKQYSGRRLVEVVRRVVQGSVAEVLAWLRQTRTGQQVNTSYIERLNGTFRSCLAALVRRGRCLAQQQRTLHSGMYLVGSLYNFCWEHRSLRLPGEPGQPKWQPRTPAMAAGWIDRPWSIRELLEFRTLNGLHG